MFSPAGYLCLSALDFAFVLNFFLYIHFFYSCHESRKACQTPITSPDRREGNVHRMHFIFTKMCGIQLSVSVASWYALLLLKAANVTKDFPVGFSWPQHSLYVTGWEHHWSRLQWHVFIVLPSGLSSICSLDAPFYGAPNCLGIGLGLLGRRVWHVM